MTSSSDIGASRRVTRASPLFGLLATALAAAAGPARADVVIPPGASTAPATSTPANGPTEVVQIRMASMAPAGTPWERLINEIRDDLARKSNGRIKINTFLGGMLGDENAMVDQTLAGRIQMFGGTTGALASAIPELNLLELPFLFRTYEEADHILDKVLADDLKKLFESKGFIFMLWSENGWRSFGTKDKPVRSPDALKGLKMRAQPNRVHLDMYKAFGAVPLALPVTEALNELESGAADGFDQAPVFAQAANWQTAIKHFTLTRHIYQPGALLYQKKWFDAQPPEIQKLLLAGGADYAVKAREWIRALDGALMQNFRDNGVLVHEITKAERLEFEKRLAPVYEAFKAISPEAKRLTEKTLAALEEYRSPPVVGK